MVKPNPGHRLDQEELQCDAHNPVHLWIYTHPCTCFQPLSWWLWARFALNSLLIWCHLLLLQWRPEVFWEQRSLKKKAGHAQLFSLLSLGC